MFTVVLDKKKLNVLAADVASVFATMVPLVLAGARTFLVDKFSFGCARCSLHDTLIRLAYGSP